MCTLREPVGDIDRIEMYACIIIIINNNCDMQIA